MKKKSLSATNSLFIILVLCLCLTAMSLKADLTGRYDAGKSYRDQREINTDNEEETGDYLIWESLSHHLFAFNR